MKSFRFLTVALLASLLSACDDEDNPDFGRDAGATGDAAIAHDTAGDVATAGDVSAPTDVTITTVLVLGPETPATNPPAPKGLAVINGDYSSVSLSLVDPTSRTVVKDGCIGSGSAVPRLSMAFSGDVSLPSQPQPGNFAVLIDRGNSTLTWVDPATCAAVHQISVAGGFKANPHDLVVLSATKAYVTRYGTSATGEGSDILIINHSAGTLTGRIDLKAQATAGPAGKVILPSPDRMVLVDGKVYVSLNNLSADYDAAGAGRVVIIDPATDTLAGTIDIPVLKNCGTLNRVPGTNVLSLGCAGPFSDGPKQIATAGIATIDLTGPPVVKTLAGALFQRPVSNSGLVMNDATRGFVVVFGHDLPAPAVPDQLWSFDIAAGTARKVYEGRAPYSLAGLTGAGDRVYLADAWKSAPKLLVFDTSATFQLALTTAASGLPPRGLAQH